MTSNATNGPPTNLDNDANNNSSSSSSPPTLSSFKQKRQDGTRQQRSIQPNRLKEICQDLSSIQTAPLFATGRQLLLW
ncbi:hypothetical protein TNIN_153841 [Trichonephila inaurata madagascariensis]|uniref:Uncharacterized protein n=1 Tax=Trichonephila inaurata madagascariensis TaxID=2747483 RepID=A0A8X6X6F0_9ARAC|nr:hypothetical protein TNIN_153841 [Trichonephila inaurata madagascariensis]